VERRHLRCRRLQRVMPSVEHRRPRQHLPPGAWPGCALGLRLVPEAACGLVSFTFRFATPPKDSLPLVVAGLRFAYYSSARHLHRRLSFSPTHHPHHRHYDHLQGAHCLSSCATTPHCPLLPQALRSCCYGGHIIPSHALLTPRAGHHHRRRDHLRLVRPQGDRRRCLRGRLQEDHRWWRVVRCAAPPRGASPGQCRLIALQTPAQTLPPRNKRRVPRTPPSRSSMPSTLSV
jgi:hypothetical protein